MNVTTVDTQGGGTYLLASFEHDLLAAQAAARMGQTRQEARADGWSYYRSLANGSIVDFTYGNGTCNPDKLFFTTSGSGCVSGKDYNDGSSWKVNDKCGWFMSPLSSEEHFFEYELMQTFTSRVTISVAITKIACATGDSGSLALELTDEVRNPSAQRQTPFRSGVSIRGCGSLAGQYDTTTFPAETGLRKGTGIAVRINRKSSNLDDMYFLQVLVYASCDERCTSFACGMEYERSCVQGTVPPYQRDTCESGTPAPDVRFDTYTMPMTATSTGSLSQSCEPTYTWADAPIRCTAPNYIENNPCGNLYDVLPSASDIDTEFTAGGGHGSSEWANNGAVAAAITYGYARPQLVNLFCFHQRLVYWHAAEIFFDDSQTRITLNQDTLLRCYKLPSVQNVSVVSISFSRTVGGNPGGRTMTFAYESCTAVRTLSPVVVTSSKSPSQSCVSVYSWAAAPTTCTAIGSEVSWPCTNLYDALPSSSDVNTAFTAGGADNHEEWVNPNANPRMLSYNYDSPQLISTFCYQQRDAPGGAADYWQTVVITVNGVLNDETTINLNQDTMLRCYNLPFVKKVTLVRMSFRRLFGGGLNPGGRTVTFAYDSCAPALTLSRPPTPTPSVTGSGSADVVPTRTLMSSETLTASVSHSGSRRTLSPSHSVNTATLTSSRTTSGSPPSRSPTRTELGPPLTSTQSMTSGGTASATGTRLGTLSLLVTRSWTGTSSQTPPITLSGPESTKTETVMSTITDPQSLTLQPPRTPSVVATATLSAGTATRSWTVTVRPPPTATGTVQPPTATRSVSIRATLSEQRTRTREATATVVPPPPPLPKPVMAEALPPAQATVEVSTTAASLTGVNPALATQASLLSSLRKLDLCATDPDAAQDDSVLSEQPPIAEHPLRFGIAAAGEAQQYHAGQVVGNVLACGLFGVAALGIGAPLRLAWGRRSAAAAHVVGESTAGFVTTYRDAVAWARFPALLAFPVVFLMPAVAAASVQLLVKSTTILGFALGAIGAVLVLCITGGLIFLFARKFSQNVTWASTSSAQDEEGDATRSPAAAVDQPLLASSATVAAVAEQGRRAAFRGAETIGKLIDADGQWLALDGSWVTRRGGGAYDGTGHMMRSLGMFFEAYRESAPWYLVLELGLTCAISVATGMISIAGCRGSAWVLLVLYAFYFASLVYLRPHACRADRVIYPLLLGAQALVSLLAVVTIEVSLSSMDGEKRKNGELPSDVRALQEMTNGLLAIVASFGGVLAIYEIAKVVYLQLLAKARERERARRDANTAKADTSIAADAAHLLLTDPDVKPPAAGMLQDADLAVSVPLYVPDPVDAASALGDGAVLNPPAPRAHHADDAMHQSGANFDDLDEPSAGHWQPDRPEGARVLVDLRLPSRGRDAVIPGSAKPPQPPPSSDHDTQALLGAEDNEGRISPDPFDALLGTPPPAPAVVDFGGDLNDDLGGGDADDSLLHRDGAVASTSGAALAAVAGGRNAVVESHHNEDAAVDDVLERLLSGGTEPSSSSSSATPHRPLQHAHRHQPPKTSAEIADLL